MKKIIIIIAIAMALAASPAFASGGRPHKPNMNIHFLGSDDHQKKNNNGAPNNPVSVPEPASMILLGAGLMAFGAYHKLRKDGRND